MGTSDQMEPENGGVCGKRPHQFWKTTTISNQKKRREWHAQKTSKNDTSSHGFSVSPWGFANGYPLVLYESHQQNQVCEICDFNMEKALFKNDSGFLQSHQYM